MNYFKCIRVDKHTHTRLHTHIQNPRERSIWYAKNLQHLNCAKVRCCSLIGTLFTQINSIITNQNNNNNKALRVDCDYITTELTDETVEMIKCACILQQFIEILTINSNSNNKKKKCDI